jgi:hypothetical protein
MSIRARIIYFLSIAWVPLWRPFGVLGILFILSPAKLAYSQLPLYPPDFVQRSVSTACSTGVLACSQYGVIVSGGSPPDSLEIQFTASPALCSNVQVLVSIDGTPVGTSAFLAPGQSMLPLTASVPPGNHSIGFTPTFQTACNASGSVFVFGSASGTVVQPAVGAPTLSSFALGALAVALAGCAFLMMTKALQART